MTPILDLDQLTKYFRHQWTFRPFCAVRDLTLTLREKEIFGLIGHNGAGKTTTFKLLLGILRPTRGGTYFLGKPSASQWARRQIGFLPEHPYFYDYLSVRETLDFYGRLSGLTRTDSRQRIGELAERLRFTSKLDTPIRLLSKGTLQRVGIAQAIMHQPLLVILDEPMSGLDPGGRKEMRDLIHSLKNHGSTVIFSSHILPDAEALCDRVGILANGELREVIDLSPLANEEARTYSLSVSNLQPHALQALTGLAGAPTRNGARVWTFTLSDRVRVNEILRVVAAAGGFVESLTPVTISLEDRFLAHMGSADGPG